MTEAPQPYDALIEMLESVPPEQYLDPLVLRRIATLAEQGYAEDYAQASLRRKLRLRARWAWMRMRTWWQQ
jgi:hypothetical protein